MNEDIYVQLPTEFFPSEIGNVFKLRRALYGLKQSPQAWQSELSRTLSTIGFVACEKDPCVYVLLVNGNLRAICGVHVDDGILGAIGTDVMNSIIRLLVSAYRITIVPEPKIYLVI